MHLADLKQRRLVTSRTATLPLGNRRCSVGHTVTRKPMGLGVCAWVRTIARPLPGLTAGVRGRAGWPDRARGQAAVTAQQPISRSTESQGRALDVGGRYTGSDPSSTSPWLCNLTRGNQPLWSQFPSIKWEYNQYSSQGPSSSRVDSGGQYL